MATRYHGLHPHSEAVLDLAREHGFNLHEAAMVLVCEVAVEDGNSRFFLDSLRDALGLPVALTTPGFVSRYERTEEDG
jgi:hypothetical protein